MARRTILLLLLPLALLSACGGDDSANEETTTTAAPQTTTTAAAGGASIVDASKTRDDLLAAAAAALAGKDPVKDNLGATNALAAAWKITLPGASLSGTGVEAAPGPRPVVSVSTVGGINSVNSKDLVGPANPFLVVVTVKDTSGKCAGGSLRGYPTPTAQKRFDVTGPCNAGAAKSLA